MGRYELVISSLSRTLEVDCNVRRTGNRSVVVISCRMICAPVSRGEGQSRRLKVILLSRCVLLMWRSKDSPSTMHSPYMNTIIAVGESDGHQSVAQGDAKRLLLI